MIYMNRILLILPVVIVLQGCGVSSPLVGGSYTNTELVDYPEVNIYITAGLGETLVRKGIKQSGSAVVIDSPVTFNTSRLGICNITVQPGSFFQDSIYQRPNATLNGAVCHSAGLAITTDNNGEVDWNCPGDAISVSICYSDQIDSFFLVSGGADHWRLPNQSIGIIRREQRAVQRQTNFVQEFIYNGRVDNNLKFIYREFTNDLARPAFTQEVQYDANESNVIGFRALRVEVASSSNTEITYKLISNF
jgi:hypothetical protein